MKALLLTVDKLVNTASDDYLCVAENLMREAPSPLFARLLEILAQRPSRGHGASTVKRFDEVLEAARAEMEKQLASLEDVPVTGPLIRFGKDT